jgi:ribosomal protein L24
MSTCEYYLSNINVLKLKKEGHIDIHWFSYFMDPHAFFIGNSLGNSRRIEIERQVYEHCDMIFVTEEIYNENKTNTLNKYIEKTHPVKYSNFRILQRDNSVNIFDKSKVNFVFAGSLLDERIRDPKYFYEIINHANKNYLFHFIVNNMSQRNAFLKDAILKNKENTRWYNNLPLDTCLHIICEADVLVNLGNKSVNQTPSKIFDYIGTGNPIVNFYSLSDDTSKRYLERYPNHLNIFEDYTKMYENEAILDRFVSDCLGKKVSEDKLINIYGNYIREKTVASTVQTIIDYCEGK